MLGGVRGQRPAEQQALPGRAEVSLLRLLLGGSMIHERHPAQLGRVATP